MILSCMRGWNRYKLPSTAIVTLPPIEFISVARPGGGDGGGSGGDGRGSSGGRGGGEGIDGGSGDGDYCGDGGGDEYILM